MQHFRSSARSMALRAFCAMVVGSILSANAALTHRWSFNNPVGNAASGTVMVDTVSAAAATLRGNGSTFTGNSVNLTGATTGNRSAGFISGYLDLPNGIISSKTDLSIEIWATPLSGKTWMRLFDFGRTAGNTGFGAGSAAGEINDVTGTLPGVTAGSDSLFLSLCNGSNSLSAQTMEMRLNGGNPVTVTSALATTAGIQNHYVFTFEDSVGTYGSSGGRMSWYRNGTRVGSGDVAFHLSAVEDVNNWLGRSQWTADNNANVSYNEVRLYDHVLSAAEISANLDAGPDSTVAPPDPVVAPTPTHLWTFTETAASTVGSGREFPDLISGVVATLRGNGASLSGGSLVLPGNTTGNQAASAISAYLDLPNGLISAQAGIAVEAWVTPLSSRAYQRLFDFGRTNLSVGAGALAGEIVDGPSAPGAFAGYDNLVLSLNVGMILGQQRLEGQINNGAAIFSDTTAATVAGTSYHYVLTVTDGTGIYGPAGCQAKWYRNGTLQNSLDLAFHLTAMEDVNNWIGRSQYASDSCSNMALNELRFYNHAISAGEVLASYRAGPDPGTGNPEPPVPAPLPDHRWDFNASAGTLTSGSPFIDSASGEIATVRGNGGALTGTALTLPGTSNGNQPATTISAYLDLPNGMVSSKASLTIEAWATPLSSKTWQRLFDFGRSSLTSGVGAAAGEILDGPTAPGAFTAYDNLLLSLNNNAVPGSHRLEGRLNGGPTLTFDTDLSTSTSAGVEHHYILTVLDGAGIYGAGGCQARWYRDAALQGSLDLNFHLNQLSDVNNWIGRSQWAADMNSNISLNELRIYNHALSAGEVTASFVAGANPRYPPPVVFDDSVDIHPNQKVLLKVLSNDTGQINPSTLVIVSAPAIGSAVVRTSGEILYSHSGTGTDPVTITYQVAGEGGLSGVGTVHIRVSRSLRIPISGLNVPSEPPPTVVQVVPAYPGVTFAKPLVFLSPPGDLKRLFVGELGGKLKVIPDVTAANPTSSVVLDLVSVVSNPARVPAETLKPGGNPECGLLGAAFHPDFEKNGYFYVVYSVGKSTDTAVWYQRLSRFTLPVGEIGQPAPKADPTSEWILFEQRDRDDNHNGGDLHFGADGYLYMSVGDEANPNDTRKNSQRIDMNFFGGMLRIDVDKRPGNPEPNAHVNPSAAGLGYSAVNGIPRDEIPLGSGNFFARYSIPFDNPYVSISQGGKWNGTFNGVLLGVDSLPYIRSEFYAVGLRSPWRFSIDPPSGEIWVGDVGQDTYEELDIITQGGNSGWAFREGLHAGPKSAPAGFSPVDPIWEYTHTGSAGGDSNFKGNSIIGGVVYRGTRFADLTGNYIFGDQVSGHIWALTRPGGVVSVRRIAGQAALANFGTDPSNGDVLVSDYQGGRIMRIITTTPSTGFPTLLSETGLFADLADMSPSPGLLPYQPNLAFWSDYAVKRRWFTLPDTSRKMTWARDGSWSFPSGQIWVKHFDLETDRGNPASVLKRIETRLLVKNDQGAYGVSYRWNEAGTDATLASDGGEDFSVNLTVEGAPYTQLWRIPSRSQCLTCHSPQAGHALSFNTRQLNLENTINGFTGNQLDLLYGQGYLANDPGSPNLLPRHLRAGESQFPLEERVRSYLAVNCAYCHMGISSTAPTAWDGRHEINLEETHLINVSSGLAGDPFKLVVPGDPAHSIALHRLTATAGFTRMPPLGSQEMDQVNIALVTDWINQSLPNRTSYANWRITTFGSSMSAVGEPAADPDGDGVTNISEFIAGTSARSAQSFPQVDLSMTGSNVMLKFETPLNRSVQVETSDDLRGWSLWDVPGNNGTPLSSGKTTFSGPIGGAGKFYRLLIRER